MTLHAVFFRLGIVISVSSAALACPAPAEPADPATLLPILVGGGSLGVVETPVLSLAGGVYQQGQTLTISCATADVQLYYTTDGTTPAASNGTLYSGSVALGRSSTLKVVGVKSGWTSSATAYATYVIRATSFDVVYRDFLISHPDFEDFVGSEAGIVSSTIGSDRTPVYANPGTTTTTTGAANFSQWYHDVAGVNKRIDSTLPISSSPTTCYYDSSAFFPIDGQGWGNETNAHNFHFTTEIRTWILVESGTVLTVYGDDDWWVFINGKLAIDLGGVHGAMTGSITIDAAARTTYGLTLGEPMRVEIFQAERHTTVSNFRISSTSPCYRM